MHDSVIADSTAAQATEIPAARVSRAVEESSIKDTVEQILIAFILAFIFRAFVVEAFVIPTGSMAPTLMGAHMRFTCDDCGYQFEENFNAASSGDDIVMPADNHAGKGNRTVICPNCGYRLPAASPGDSAFNPLVRFGDRILVLKYLYLFQQPSRWDVVVFKSPDRQQQYDFQQNYIKRLVGRPNETILILDGDIYAGPNNAPLDQLVVQTKPRKVQDSLWRIVADSDFVPRGLSRMTQPWMQPWIQRSGQTGWKTADPASSQSATRVFDFNNAAGSAELFFKDTVNAGSYRPSKFNDWLAYDANEQTPDWNIVGDLKVQFYYERTAGDGPLQVRLSKRGETFIAELSPTGAKLLHENQSGDISEVFGNKPLNLAAGHSHQVEFTNVDYCVTLRVDGEDIFQTTPAQYHPDVAKLIEEESRRRDDVLPPSASIRAIKETCRVTHLSLWRDIYYISRGGMRFNGTVNNPMRLGPDEYFCMGDNSQISGDGRYWNEPTNLPYENLRADAGKVPGRFMLGKAFFVYWPAGYRPFDSAPALAPDFGDMRFIH